MMKKIMMKKNKDEEKKDWKKKANGEGRHLNNWIISFVKRASWECSFSPFLNSWIMHDDQLGYGQWNFLLKSSLPFSRVYIHDFVCWRMKTDPELPDTNGTHVAQWASEHTALMCCSITAIHSEFLAPRKWEIPRSKPIRTLEYRVTLVGQERELCLSHPLADTLLLISTRCASNRTHSH